MERKKALAGDAWLPGERERGASEFNAIRGHFSPKNANTLN
jgi:hypothetical protein